MKKRKMVFYIIIIVIVILILFSVKKYNYYIVESGSMQPTLKAGDLVIAKSQEKYEQKDIITFFDNEFGGYVTHRVMQVTKDGKFITKGDANNVCDKNMVAENQIVGKVILHSQILGLLLYKYKTVTIILMLVIFIVGNLYFIIFKEREGT